VDIREIGWRGVGWMRLPQVRDQWRDQNAAMNLRVP
jgi:hypothetical protein